MKERECTGNSLCTLRISIADMVSLNVRSINPELPKTLYQDMPLRAMALMSTVPCGAFAVSISGETGGSRGYPILKYPPLSAEGFVIAYDRHPNGRYVAAAVRYRNRDFKIAEFFDIACRWAERNGRIPKPVAGRYAYFVPTRDEWGVILRDSGYSAWDPASMPSALNAELLLGHGSQQSSAIVARIPVFTGDGRREEEVLPAFAQTEVTLDPDPGPHSIWLSYAEYKRIRILASQPPDTIVRDFHDWLGLLTKESGFEYWIFNPGMLFGDHIEWWGDRCRRRTEHEGFDFARGSIAGTGIRFIPEGVPVRSMADGDVVAMLDDFLGKTVVVRHPAIIRPNGDVFHTLLSHIQPRTTKMSPVTKGQVVGEVPKTTNPRVPAHLHLTAAWIPPSLTQDELKMDHIHPAFAPVILTDITPLLRSNPLCRWDIAESN
ncbi:MAG: M23 family metallopeptidase [Acidobacteria bacterium]|nr:M23 family metallopeptidase [Acidobacteriota bacterium]